MKHILARAHKTLLCRIARRNSLLAFDFDGTLAPIVPDPGKARMRPRTRRLLRRLAGRYPCAVISGRALPDLRPRLTGVPLRCLVGNHGAEWGRAARNGAGQVRRTVRAWRRLVAGRLEPIPGLVLEDKGLSLTAHFGQSQRRRAADRAILQAVAGLEGSRIVRGRLSINILHAAAAHKGMALMRIRDRIGGEGALYVGDDVTDEDAFSAGSRADVVTIRIGSSRFSRAAYYLRDQGEIDDLLAALLALREPGGRPKAPSADGRRGHR